MAEPEPVDPAVDMDRLVEAVVERLVTSGLATGGATAAVVKEEPELIEDPAASPPRAKQRMWLAELRGS